MTTRSPVQGEAFLAPDGRSTPEPRGGAVSGEQPSGSSLNISFADGTQQWIDLVPRVMGFASQQVFGLEITPVRGAFPDLAAQWLS